MTADEIAQYAEKWVDIIVRDAQRSAADNDEAMALVHAVWVNLICELALLGWTPQELINDCGWHAANITSDGTA